MKKALNISETQLKEQSTKHKNQCWYLCIFSIPSFNDIMFSEGETIVRRSTVGVSSGWENVVLAESEPGVEELELGKGGRGSSSRT